MTCSRTDCFKILGLNMPMPIGGAFALRNSAWRHYENQQEAESDPDLEEFKEHQKHIFDNLTCNVNFFKGYIPPRKGTLSGLMILETKEEIEHCGIFILMKGLPLVPATRKKPGKKPPLSHVKFTVLENTYSRRVGGEDGEGEVILVEGRSRETYPLELEIPENLPPPQVTADGRLLYKMQAFMGTVKGRHVLVWEGWMRWMGWRGLAREEVEKGGLRVELLVQSRRSVLGLVGRRKSSEVEWRLEKGAYLLGEGIGVELWGECREKGGMEMEVKVELMQKVWYQTQSLTSRSKLWVKMKVNVVEVKRGMVEMEGWEGEEGEEIERKMVWRAEVKLDKKMTPSWKYDFMNNVSYTVRGSVRVKGEGGEWVVGELPIVVGNRKEGKGGEEEEVEVEVDDGDLGGGEERSPSPRSPDSPGGGGGGRPRSGSVGGSPVGARRSQSMFIPDWVRGGRDRSGSIASMGSMQSLASSTLSIFRLPPSYSQLSSRRPTLETLPPAYCDLDIEGQQRSTDKNRVDDRENGICGFVDGNDVDLEGRNKEEISDADKAEKDT